MTAGCIVAMNSSENNKNNNETDSPKRHVTVTFEETQRINGSVQRTYYFNGSVPRIHQVRITSAGPYHAYKHVRNTMFLLAE